MDQITFEMFHISKVSFCRKCDLRQNPRHAVARCTTVQRWSIYLFSKGKCSKKGLLPHAPTP